MIALMRTITPPGDISWSRWVASSLTEAIVAVIRAEQVDPEVAKKTARTTAGELPEARIDSFEAALRYLSSVSERYEWVRQDLAKVVVKLLMGLECDSPVDTLRILAHAADAENWLYEALEREASVILGELRQPVADLAYGAARSGDMVALQTILARYEAALRRPLVNDTLSFCTDLLASNVDPGALGRGGRVECAPTKVIAKPSRSRRSASTTQSTSPLFPANSSIVVRRHGERVQARFFIEVPQAGIRGEDVGRLGPALLGEQLQFLDACTELPAYCSIELRLQTFDTGHGTLSSRLFVIGAVTAGSDFDAQARATQLHADLNLLLPSTSGFYTFRDIDDPSIVEAAIASSSIRAAEILRREELVGSAGDAPRYVLHPYRETTATFGSLFARLEAIRTPTAWSVVIRPTVLHPFERDFHAVDSSDDLDTGPSISMAHGRQLLVRTFVTSGLPVSPALLAAIGSEMTAAPADRRKSDSNNRFDTRGAHAFRLRVPRNAADEAFLLRELGQHSFAPLPPQLAPRRLERLRYLFEPREALSAFRLPLPEADGQVGRLPFRPIRTYNVPVATASDGLYLGDSRHGSVSRRVCISGADMGRHVYTVGQTGTGKSTLLRNMILQDIRAGHGVGVIDPHGDLVESILADIPDERIEDVVYFNPVDTEQPIGLNILDGRDETEQLLLVNEAVGVFVRLFGPEIFGPRLQDYFRNMALTLAQAPDGGALTDLVPLTINKQFQEKARKSVVDPIVRQFWQQYDMQGSREKEEMIPFWAAKFSPFYAEPLMRNIVGQVRSGFQVSDIMDTGKIFLANLAKGAVGEVNSQLLGLLLMARIQTAVMLRARTARADRRSFRLYVDEFQNYASSGFSTLLSEGRKYGLSLVLANQFTSQLLGTSGVREHQGTNVWSAIIGNVGNLIVFRVGAHDAAELVPVLGPRFTAGELTALPNFLAVSRLLDEGQVRDAINLETVSRPPREDQKRQEAIASLSRLTFGRSRDVVEQEIFERLELPRPQVPHWHRNLDEK